MEPLASSTLEDVQRALTEADVDALRRSVLTLSESERERLALFLGDRTMERLYRAARGRRRSRKRGHVVVLHGIMGAQLDSVDASGDADRIWLNYLRLAFGRIADLELDDAGEPTRPVTVRTAGQMQSVYAPLLLELDREWHVLPFAFDWRHDIDRSADRLAGAIARFAAGAPVHLVAHSMGGLVSRRFSQLHPDLWSSMQGGDGKGGRLVMLGTPNRGSYAIPLALSGMEKLVKGLALLDVRHDMPALLAILDSFAGSYQMLPSPALDLDDDHKALFDATSWGRLPVKPALLQRAERFLTGLETAIDPERFVYVAGYDRKTPFRIRITGPGKFELKHTSDGDGRVPHALGLLPGVPTFWVDATHGDLAKNEEVLDAIDDLLAEGESPSLVTSRPTRRRGAEETEGDWVPADAVDPVPGEVKEILARGRRSGTRQRPAFSQEDEAALQALLLGDWLGGSDALRSRSAHRQRSQHTERRRKAAPRIELEVCWGDIRKVPADVYSVGHYQGVEPQNAEKALDEAVSGLDTEQEKKTGHRVIREHTRRGSLRGALGDIHFFPWRTAGAKGDRIVAVAGMGYPGSFGHTALRRLIRELALSVDGLPHVKSVCTVLIGSGAGTLSIREAVDGLLQGLAEAVATGRMSGRIRRIQVVELARHRAHEIQDALEEAVGASQDGVHFALAPRVKAVDGGGSVSTGDALSVVLAAALRAGSARAGSERQRALAELLESVPGAKLREGVDRAIASLGEKVPRELDLRDVGYRVAALPRDDGRGIPTRISIFEDRGLLRAAAITHSTTVAERILPAGLHVVEDLVSRINDPLQPLMENALSFVTRLLFPRDFRELLGGDGPFVFEVDRSAAQIHWELLAQLGGVGEVVPLATRKCVARQLRTGFAPPPEPEAPRSGPLRALVIGDPGDPKRGEDLPGARREALEVVRLLESARGPDGTPLIEVEALVGAPGADRRGIPRRIAPATLTRVLDLLMHGRFDLLHYCGHGDFDPDDPTRVGWVFDIGMLTSREITALDDAPSLVVANACLSGRTSSALEGRRSFREARTEAGLLPSLSDAFFRLGVRNYVGTSWEVSDVGAIGFASTLYRSLLLGAGPTPVGEAVMAARAALYDQRGSLGKLWAAYQHYGDPGATLRSPGPPPGT